MSQKLKFDIYVGFGNGKQMENLGDCMKSVQKAIVQIVTLPLMLGSIFLGNTAYAKFVNSSGTPEIQINATTKQLEIVSKSRFTVCLSERGGGNLTQSGEDITGSIHISPDDASKFINFAKTLNYQDLRGKKIGRINLNNGEKYKAVFVATNEEQQKCDEYTP